MDFIDQIYYGNTVGEYLIAGAIAVGVVIAANLIRLVLVRKIGALASRTATRLDDLVVHVLERTRFWVILVVALYLGTLYLVLSPKLTQWLHGAAVIVMLVQIGVWATGGVVFLVADYKKRKQEEGDTSSLGSILLLGVIARMVLWVLVLLLILDNVGIDVTALVAGLGIGGIAVALALQNILGDLFASVSIMLDKPFEVGDFIIVGTEMGTVENIGVKTTRARSLTGELLVFSNNDLLQSRIRNYKHMTERRILFTIGVTYQTPVDQIEALPGVLAGIVEGLEGVRLDRAHFKGFGDSALLYEVVYYVLAPEYPVYMDAQQKINLAIVRELASRGVEFAYPTQTLYVQKVE